MARSRRRRVLETFMLLALIGACLGIASMSQAASTGTRSSLSLSLITPTMNVGPFVTAQQASTATDSPGALRIAQSDLSFAPVEATLRARQFSIALVPASDLRMSIDPKQGTAAISGDFTLQFTETQRNVTCQTDPFTVNATTTPTGTSPYSPTTGSATAIDAAPSVAAISGCGGAGNVVNAAVPLPITPPTTTTTATTSATSTIPVPRVEVHLTLSPPLRPSTTSTTTTTTAPAAPGPTARPAIAAQPPSAQHVALPPSRAPHEHRHSTKKKAAAHEARSKTATPGPTLGTPSAFPSSLATPLEVPAASAGLDPPLAFAPASSQHPDAPSTPGLVLFGLLATIGLAVALWLIRSDVRPAVRTTSRRPVRTGRLVRPGSAGH